MVLSIPQLQNLTLHLMVEKIEEGRSRARVLELPDCVVEAPSSEEAIEQLQAMIRERFTGAELVSFDVPLNVRTERENPWTEFIGLYEGDSDFAEIASELRRERGFDEMGLMQ